MALASVLCARNRSSAAPGDNQAVTVAPETAVTNHVEQAQSTSPSMLESALQYAEHGYYVFPLYPVDKAGTCSCKSADCKPGKHPLGKLVPNGHTMATVDATTIEQWWAEWPDAGIGIALEPSGLVVVGPDSIVWKEKFTKRGLPETATTSTGGGLGHEHYYYRRPDDCQLDRINKPKRYDIMSAGYVVAAPTLHELGARYRAKSAFPVVDALPLAPDWVVDELERANEAETVRAPATRSRHTDLGAVVTKMINEPRHLPAILPLLGIPANASQSRSGILCPLGCGDTRKSASLYQGDNRVIAVHTHHGCQGDRTVWLPASLYAGLRTGDMRSLRGPELAAWSLMLLRDARIIVPANIERPITPSRFTSRDNQVLDAFCEVLALAHAVGLTEISFTRRFAAAWTGLEQNQIKVAWEHIRDAKLVKCVREHAGRHSAPALWRLLTATDDDPENP
jgi:hypothetical protein